MKIEYVRPEYENNNQLADIILISIEENLDENKITGVIDIEDLFEI